jgi:mRNA interferase RelE/StbE
MTGMRVIFSAEGLTGYQELPRTIRARVDAIVERLADWPQVSGAKPMRGDLAGHWRIRTGDWRVLFQVRADVIIVRIDHRSRIYED